MTEKEKTLRALCSQGLKLGLTTTEFWRQVRRYPSSEENLILAAEEALSDLRAGGCNCPKCGGSGRFIQDGEDKGICYQCKGKGFEDIADTRRNYGYRHHNRGRQEAYWSK